MAAYTFRADLLSGTNCTKTVELSTHKRTDCDPRSRVYRGLNETIRSQF